jgi:hypothetical protein
VDEICNYILSNLVLDLEGNLEMEALNDMLVRDGSQLARDLRARLIAEQGPNEFLFVVIDTLREHLTSGINEGIIREQVRLYLEA